MDKHGVLRHYFGYASFRQGQGELIDAIAGGRDALGVLPTGGGKSLCYQVPGIMLGGVVFVVSPLISLMKDQVEALRKAGVGAAYVNSSLTPKQIGLVKRNILAGKYKIIYIAPERLMADGFVTLARELDISLMAIDEAHCISQWGQDFRPSYLKIVEFLEKLTKRPVLAAFTATATLQVRDDIERILKLRDPLRLVTGFDRPNLRLEVWTPRDKQATILSIVANRRGQSGIVYCSTRRAVEEMCMGLRGGGIKATRYHAGLRPDERRDNQEAFIRDDCPVMVATNAFGMGIDKPNVRYVIHNNMPKSLEAYYQEAGRAGRDGLPSECFLLFSPDDIGTAEFFIKNGGENVEMGKDERRMVMLQDYRRLDAMIAFCKTTACLRGVILDYFGEAHAKACGNCGNCRAKQADARKRERKPPFKPFGRFWKKMQ
jgi:ATP-dependent DNA helicase RecQ